MRLREPEATKKDHAPDDYNIRIDCRVAAGQSVMQFHYHVIPRYRGDMENPKGEVRYCIPEKGISLDYVNCIQSKTQKYMLFLCISM
jgi:diadenosine tetraphosphate (Ap4A) HIT family hydrolase